MTDGVGFWFGFGLGFCLVMIVADWSTFKSEVKTVLRHLKVRR